MFKLTQKSYGFTLIEVLIAMSIFAISILSVAGFFVYANKNIRFARNTTIASNLAQKLIEENLAKSYQELNLGTSTKTRFSNDPASSYYSFQYQEEIGLINSDLNPITTDIGLKKILVTIYWQEGTVEKNVQMATIKNER